MSHTAPLHLSSGTYHGTVEALRVALDAFALCLSPAHSVSACYVFVRVQVTRETQENAGMVLTQELQEAIGWANKVMCTITYPHTCNCALDNLWVQNAHLRELVNSRPKTTWKDYQWSAFNKHYKLNVKWTCLGRSLVDVCSDILREARVRGILQVGFCCF